MCVGFSFLRVVRSSPEDEIIAWLMYRLEWMFSAKPKTTVILCFAAAVWIRVSCSEGTRRELAM
jgi:hypothetical protein